MNLCLKAKRLKKDCKPLIRASTNIRKEAKTFAWLIEKGKVNKAIKILEKSKKGGIQILSDKTFDILQIGI